MHSILAVDDSASMRQMVSFTLKSAGYNVVEAVDGQDACEKAGSRDFDLVLTDQNMPRLDGIGLTKKLRDNPKFKTTPILILTTESSDQMKQAGRAAGATGWLVKPFDPAKLIEVIQQGHPLNAARTQEPRSTTHGRDEHRRRERRRRHRPEPVLPGLLRGGRREPRAAWSSMLLELDIDAADDEELNAIFRCAHSIKGGAATFGFADVAELTHQMETLLDKLRRHELQPTAADGRRAAAVGRRAARPAGAPPGRGRRRRRHRRAAGRASARWSHGEAPPAPRAAAARRAGAPRPRRRRRRAGRCRPSQPRAARAARRPAGAARRRPTTWSSCSTRSPTSARIEPLDGGQASDGMRRFKVTTTSSDSDLLDLFTFHVAREQVRAAAAGPGLRLPRRRARRAREPSRSGRPGYGFFDDAPGAPGRQRRRTPPQRGRAAAAAGGRRPSRRPPRQAEKAAGRHARSRARCACRSRRSTSSSTWWANSSSPRPCWRRTAASSTRRCTSSWPPAWPTWSATPATCRKR